MVKHLMKESAVENINFESVSSKHLTSLQEKTL